MGWPLPPPGPAPAEVFQVSSISENQRKMDMKFQTELLSSYPKVPAKGLTGWIQKRINHLQMTSPSPSLQGKEQTSDQII